MHNPNPRARAIRRERIRSCGIFLFVALMILPGCIGGGIGILAAVSAVGIIPVAMNGTFPFSIFAPDEILRTRLGVELRDLGDHDPKRFDPVKGVPLVQSFAGDGAELLRIRATGVRKDGTIDLTASYRPKVDYEFVRRVPRPADAPPLGAGGNATGEWQEKVTVVVEGPGQGRMITSYGGNGSTEVQYTTRGMERTAQKPVSAPYPATIVAPACGMDVLWRIAVERSTPADAVATIEYTGKGFAFNVVGTSYRLEAAPDCEAR